MPIITQKHDHLDAKTNHSMANAIIDLKITSN